jgi:hypothetical protein
MHADHFGLIASVCGECDASASDSAAEILPLGRPHEGERDLLDTLAVNTATKGRQGLLKDRFNAS